MKLILNGNLEFEVARKPKLSGDPIQIPLKDISELPAEITGEVILQEMIVWPTQETVAPPPPLPEIPEPEIPEETVEGEVIESEEPVEEVTEGEEVVEEGVIPEVPEVPEIPEIPPVEYKEPEPEVFVLYKTNAEDWLRHYVSGNILCFTNKPIPPEPVPPTEEEIRAQLEADARRRRDSLIAETDWTQVLDAPISAECREAFRVYRQTLRDVPQQENFPYDIIWPEKPEVVKATPDPVDTAVAVLVGGEE